MTTSWTVTKTVQKHGTEHGTILLLLLDAWLLVWCMITVLGALSMPTTTNHFQKIIVVEEFFCMG
jgi:hypothetical protein